MEVIEPEGKMDKVTAIENPERECGVDLIVTKINSSQRITEIEIWRRRR